MQNGAAAAEEAWQLFRNQLKATACCRESSTRGGLERSWKGTRSPPGMKVHSRLPQNSVGCLWLSWSWLTNYLTGSNFGEEGFYFGYRVSARHQGRRRGGPSKAPHSLADPGSDKPLQRRRCIYIEGSASAAHLRLVDVLVPLVAVMTFLDKKKWA